MQPFSGNQRRNLLTSLMNMSFVLRLPREILFKCPMLAIVFGNTTKLFSHFWQGAESLAWSEHVVFLIF